MRAPSRRRSMGVGINMTPMIDVVFQLIIFFLVSSHLAKQEAQLPLPLPVADSSLAPEPTPAKHVVINVLAGGELLLAGRPVVADQLAERLRTLRDEQSELEVKIRADRRVEYRHVEPIMLACYQAGMRKVTYSVYRSRDVR